VLPTSGLGLGGLLADGGTTAAGEGPAGGLGGALDRALGGR